MIGPEIHNMAITALDRAWQIRRLPPEEFIGDADLITQIKSIARFYHQEFTGLFGTEPQNTALAEKRSGDNKCTFHCTLNLKGEYEGDMSFIWEDGVVLFVDSSIKQSEHKIIRLLIKHGDRQLLLGPPVVSFPEFNLD